MYHGIIIDQSFNDPSFAKTFEIFNQKKDGSWGIYGIEVEDSQLDESITLIQQNMKDHEPWYAHLYNDKDLIVIFKEKVFRVSPLVSSWTPILEYGKEFSIPEDQLDISPNKFQDEAHYFQ